MGLTGVQGDVELARLSALVDAKVIGAERPAWGFANRTTIVTLVDGRRWVVQELLDPLAGRAIAQRALSLAQRLRGAGIPAPEVVKTMAGEAPGSGVPVVVTAFVPGRLGPSLLGSDRDAALLGRLMGAVHRRLADVDTDGLHLPTDWASPERLADLSRRRLETIAGRVSAVTRAAVAGAIAEHLEVAGASMPNARARFVHGDFAPANVIVAEDRLVGLIDFEYARLADPLLDAATFQWLTFHFHAARARASWDAFTDAAGIADDGPTRAALRRLRLLRILELVEVATRRGPAMRDRWVALLEASAGER